MSRVKRLLPLWIITLALLGAGLLILTKPRHKPVVATEKAWLVSVEQARFQTLSPSLTLYGKVESLWSSDLTAGVNADVQTVPVLEGQFVSKGQLLVRLDDSDAKLLLAQRQADLAEAQARIAAENTRYATDRQLLPREQRLLQLTQHDVTRLEKLVRQQASARSSLDTARLAVERQAISLAQREQVIAEHPARLAELQAREQRAEALREQAELELKRTEVKAPYNGRVARVMVAPGKRVRVGDALVRVYDTDALVVRAQIPNQYLAVVREALHKQQPLRAHGQVDGQPVTARLISLGGEVAAASGGVAGLFELQGDPAALPLGRFLRLDLQLPAQADVIAVPQEALYGTDTLYRVDAQQRIRPVRVTRVGERQGPDGQTQVLVRAPGLKAGATLITTQLPNAIDGLLVRQSGKTAP